MVSSGFVLLGVGLRIVVKQVLGRRVKAGEGWARERKMDQLLPLKGQRRKLPLLWKSMEVAVVELVVEVKGGGNEGLRSRGI